MRKGFTLIELLIVIAIIGILASAAVAMTATARKRAQSGGALQTAKSVAPYMIDCHMQNGTLHVSAAGGTVCHVSVGSDTVVGGFEGVIWPNQPNGCTYVPSDTDITGDGVVVTIFNCNGTLVRCNTSTSGCSAA